MSGEEQLERSVLERKERDELHAIAEAMALRPAARAKKADLISLILRAAGVELPADGEQAGNGGSPAAVERPRRGRSTKSDDGATEPRPSVDRGPVLPGAEDGSEPPVSEEVAPPAPNPGEGGDPAGAAAPPGPDGGPVPVPTGGDAEGAAPARSSPAGEAEGGPPGPPEGGADRVGGAERGAALPAEEPARADGIGRPAPSNGSGQVQVPAPQAAQGGQMRHEASGEPGNRRSRRRRGRDRDRGDRELQGGAQEAQFQGEPVPVSGLLDLKDEGYGFLRTQGHLPGPKDVYVSMSQARRFALRKGDYVEGASRPAAGNEKYPALLRIDRVSGQSTEEARLRPKFEELTPLFPDSRLQLEVPGDPGNVTARIVDLLAPIGKGQRGLIVSPPKAGKTSILKQIAKSIEANNPEVHLIVLLVDERPEEVTDMRRSVRGEVVASTFDRPSDEHTQLSELVIERAKRLVELGKDVVIVLDGITRLARAYNLAQPATGRIMSGGVDSGALYPPKKFFGAARNIEEGGSLTILATALIETGSRMDEVIFEEFKGTGNMELRLDRKLAERRIYPAIDVNGSSTRREELLFPRNQLQQVWKLRRVLNALDAEGSGAQGLELLMERIRTTSSNDEFLAEVAKSPAPAV
jgi:transcription termination factor Rho